MGVEIIKIYLKENALMLVARFNGTDTTMGYQSSDGSVSRITRGAMLERNAQGVSLLHNPRALLEDTIKAEVQKALDSDRDEIKLMNYLNKVVLSVGNEIEASIDNKQYEISLKNSVPAYTAYTNEEKQAKLEKEKKQRTPLAQLEKVKETPPTAELLKQKEVAQVEAPFLPMAGKELNSAASLHKLSEKPEESKPGTPEVSPKM